MIDYETGPHRVIHADGKLPLIGSLSMPGCDDVSVEMNGNSVYVHVRSGRTAITVLRLAHVKGAVRLIDRRSRRRRKPQIA